MRPEQRAYDEGFAEGQRVMEARLAEYIKANAEVGSLNVELSARLAEAEALLREALRYPHKVGSPNSTWDTRAYAALAERLAEREAEIAKNGRHAMRVTIAQLEARLAEAERDEGTLLGMIRHQRDVLRECLPYLNESMAGRRPGRRADDIRAVVKVLTADRESEAHG